MNKVPSGARNWVSVSCVHRDILLGEYSARHFSTPAGCAAWVDAENICRYHGAMVPSLLSVMNAVIFSILNNIVGGQALSSVANISWTCVVLRTA